MRPIQKRNPRAVSYHYETTFGTTTYSPMSGIRTWTDSLDGFTVDGWKDRIKKGLDATSSLSARTYESRCSPTGTTMMTRTSDGKVATSQSLLLTPPDPTTLVHAGSALAEGRATEKLVENIERTRTAFSGPTFLGELGETIGMISNPAKGLRTLANNAISAVGGGKNKLRVAGKRSSSENSKKQTNKENKRLAASRRNRGGEKKPPDRRDAKDSLVDSLAKQHLEVAFGLNPLLNDIEGALDALTSFEEGRIQRVRGKGESESVTITYGTGSAGVIPFRTETRVTQKVTVYLSCGLKMKATNVGLSNLREKAGFRLEEVVPTLYELTPWSFLVDYFSNLGSALKAATHLWSGVVWCSRTIVYETTQEIRRWPVDKTGYTMDVYAPCSSYGYSKRVVRSKVDPSTLRLPSIEFSLPGKDNQWQNIAALLGTKFL